VVWFLLITLAVVAVLTIVVIGSMAVALADEVELQEMARIEAEVRFAEQRLHGIARDSFAAMLEEARVGGQGRS
jgi:Tfp pilus assembly protein FimT